MIVLCDEKSTNYCELYHVSQDGLVTGVRYGVGQIQYAKEYIPRAEPYYQYKKALNHWCFIVEPGVIRRVEVNNLPKPLQLYRMLIGD